MLIKRNIFLFFRDRASVFFSLLGVLIIIMLYILFLGNMMEDGLRGALGFDSDLIRPVMASIILGGMVAVTSATSCLGALEIRVNDRGVSGRDFLTSPVSRGKLTRSYMLGSSFVGLVMSLAALVITVAYIALNGGALPSVADLGLLALTLILCVLCANAMMFLITAFIKTPGAFAALSGVLGSMLGFIMGVFIPIGTMPGPVQWVIRLFPMSHAAAMFRQILADGPLQDLFAGAPPAYLAEFREIHGIVYTYGTYTSDFWFSAVVLAGSTVVFYLLSVLVVRHQRG